jgi:hypothetical protein
MAEHLIRDIRYFERRNEEGALAFFPDYLGNAYPLVKRSEVVALGARFALKLAEQRFRTRDYHHVYVILTPALPAGTVRIDPLQLVPWMQWVEVGQPSEDWPVGDEAAQSSRLIQLTTQVIRSLCEAQQLEGAMLPAVEAALLEHGSKMEIQRVVKETQRYRAVASYQVLPHGQPAPLFFEFVDHKTGARGKKEVLRLKNYEDVFSLIAALSVSGGILRARPRESHRASLYTRDYQVPVEIAVAELLRSDGPPLQPGSGNSGSA